MSYEAEVQAAANPKAAMAVIARALDELADRLTPAPTEDEWAWEAATAVEVDPAPAPLVETVHTEETAEVTIAAASPAKQAKRRMFESQQLRLAKAWPDGTDWAAAYATGGPLWLYMYDRDFVMSLPYATRQRLVADVEEDDPNTAQEMGRDILKHPGETGPGGVGMFMADGNVG